MHWCAEPSNRLDHGGDMTQYALKQGCHRLRNALRCISEAILTVVHGLLVMLHTVINYQSCMHYHIVDNTDSKAVLVLLVHYFICLLSVLHQVSRRGVSAILCYTPFLMCPASVKAHTKWQPQTHTSVHSEKLYVKPTSCCAAQVITRNALLLQNTDSCVIQPGQTARTSHILYCMFRQMTQP